MTFSHRIQIGLLVTFLVAGAWACAPSPPPSSTPAPGLEDSERRITIDGIPHWVRIAGARHGTTPIVVVHGGPGGNVYAFERTAGRGLEEFVTVIYYEQRGSGRSGTPADSNDYSIPILVADLEMLRQELGIERWIPLGFSFGGELALGYALAHPERVEALILLSPTIGDWPRLFEIQIEGFLSVAEEKEALELRQVADAPGSLQERWLAVWGAADPATVDRFLFQDPHHAEQNRRLAAESGLHNRGVMLRALLRRTSDRPPLLERTNAVHAPTLILAGRHDRNVGLGAIRDLSESLPNARLLVMESSAHFPGIEQTGETVQAIRAFLGSQGR